MTNHVARLYALATTLVVFFATWLAITTHPWTQASSKANVPDARIALLQKREHRLRAETRWVNRIVDRRFVLYRKALTARNRANAAARAAHDRQLAAARVAATARPASISAPAYSGGSAVAPPAVRVVTLPPVAATRTS